MSKNKTEDKCLTEKYTVTQGNQLKINDFFSSFKKLENSILAFSHKEFYKLSYFPNTLGTVTRSF